MALFSSSRLLPRFAASLWLQLRWQGTIFLSLVIPQTFSSGDIGTGLPGIVGVVTLFETSAIAGWTLSAGRPEASIGEASSSAFKPDTLTWTPPTCQGQTCRCRTTRVPFTRTCQFRKEPSTRGISHLRSAHPCFSR